ncbi:N-acetyltransferase [Paenibacillus sp. lzh-N1]|uniref:N-acetyltransferase n=2 Tax=Paenibacillus TaxID=44249 RepID=UPI000C806221|nr:N-acetyltransferase [Paenibacillus sp. lzh-N1]AUO08789.1 N-acetyltransferase [Paenibacillus sp. lzh-N1]
MNLDIRDIRKKDIEPIKAIIADTWNAKDFIEDEGVINAAVTMMFISPILNKSTFGRVATLDGEVIGVIFGSRVGETTSYRMLQEDYTSELLQLLNLNDIERKVFVELISYLRDTKATKIYVYTDTMSNYGFYDHNGFVRLDEAVTVFNLPIGKLENTNFIYEYKL